MGGGDMSSMPMPTLATTPAVANNMTDPTTGRHPLFPTSQHPYTPQQAHSHPPQQGWAQEYLRQPSIGPAVQNNHTSHKAGITPTQRPMQLSSPGLVNNYNSYNGAQLPYSGLGFPMAQQAAGVPGQGAEISEWMGAHRPSGVALDDVDQVLNQISGELEDLVVETGPEGVSHTAAEQAGQSPAEPQPAEATEPETAHNRPDQPTGVSHLARKILQAVDHEDDEKWKGSSFLELMRDFRDGKKDVSENTIEVVTTA